MKEKRREPEVPEERVPSGECFDGLARITSKELASTHSVKSCTLQNACSTRPRVVGQGDAVTKACPQQAAADSRGSRTCVCANTFSLGRGTRREGRMN